MYLILCWSYLNHSLRFVGKKRGYKKKSHIKSQSQYLGKKSQLDYFPKSFSHSWNYVYVASEVISKVRCCLSARQGKLNKFAQIADTSKEHLKRTKRKMLP